MQPRETLGCVTHGNEAPEEPLVLVAPGVHLSVILTALHPI